MIYCLYCRFRVVSRHIGSDSNSDLGPEFPMLYNHNEWWRTTFLYENRSLFILLWVKLRLCVRPTDGGRQRQTAILTHNFFSWPYHAVLSSTPHLALRIFDRVTQPVVLQATALSGALSVTASRLWLRLPLTHSQAGIWMYYFITPRTSDKITWPSFACLNRCIHNWQLDQGSICNT